MTSRPAPVRSRLGGSFGSRLTLTLVAAAVLPLVALAILLAALGVFREPGLARVVLLAGTIAVVLAVLSAYVLSAELTAPLREIVRAVERVSAGDLATAIDVEGGDELARLADSHNRLAADLERRNSELALLLASIVAGSAVEPIERLLERAGQDARLAFGLIDVEIRLVDPDSRPVTERVPGEPIILRAELRAGADRLGLLSGRLPATRRWERADQDLLELFASEVGVAVRNAQLFERVDAQNTRLRELDAEKDDFLRAVGHNLQTPLASIRAYAQQLSGEAPDRRLGIIAEQADRLSRLVRQLLTLNRLESGALRPLADVMALAPRARRAWEALAQPEVAFTVRDDARGWLAVADADQVDQILWALLDNAVRYGRGTPVAVTVAADEASRTLRLTVVDHGPGVPDADRTRLFGRFARGNSDSTAAEVSRGSGSGLGLYVSRALAVAMDGDLVLEPAVPRTRGAAGAAFTLVLPAEAPVAATDEA